jgi:cell division protein FtsN
VYLKVTGRDLSYVRQVEVQTEGGRGPFAIQLGSFSDNLNAIRLKTAVGTELRNAYIQEVKVRGDKYYRVRVGNYSALKDAMDAARQLGEEGYPVLVVKADAGID